MSLWVSNSLYSFEYRHRRTYWCQDVVRQTAEYTSILLGEITNNPTVPGPAEFGGVAYLCLIRCFRLVTAGP